MKWMADIALWHYSGLQSDPDLDPEQHEEYIQSALEPLVAKLPTRQKGDLAKKLKPKEVMDAIEITALGKSPRLDSIPVEVWKLLHEQEEKEKKTNTTRIQIIKIMTMVFNDIENHGVHLSTGFADGWICPIYKLKKDMREIVNY